MSIAVPSVVCGMMCAAVAYGATQNAAAAVSAAASALAAAALCGGIIGRSVWRASAWLRRPELRRGEAKGLGVLRRLMVEASRQLEQLEHACEEAVRHKSELEARSRVRHRMLRRVEAALESFEQPVLLTDAHDEPLFWNTAAASLFQVPPAGDRDRTVKPDLSRIPALQHLLAETRTRNAATDRRSAEFELTMNGSTVSWRATAHALAEREGALLGVATWLQDTGRERAEKTRHAEFVSSVCHELKTPLAGIKAYVELLQDGEADDPAQQRELLEYIDDQVDRLSRMVTGMLNLARIETGVVKVQRVDCELNDVLQTAADVVAPTAADKQIRLVPQLSQLYVPVHVDPEVFGQAVVNLLSNAVKYTPAGGEVRLCSRMEEDRAVVEVRDTGLGIPEESLPRIFERFYRVPRNNKAAPGTGLGLALVHYIVTELHNGTIEVESQVDRGTCFTVTIPLGHVDAVGRRGEPARRLHSPAPCLA